MSQQDRYQILKMISQLNEDDLMNKLAPGILELEEDYDKVIFDLGTLEPSTLEFMKNFLFNTNQVCIDLYFQHIVFIME